MDSEIKVLTNKDIFPDDAVLAKHLGNAKKIFDALDVFFIEHECELNWNFYNDGKSWLCKVTKKKKTICWISVWEKYFRIKFYFGLKYDEEIRKLKMSDESKKEYFANMPIGKIKPMTLSVNKADDIDEIKAIYSFKEMLK